jgi:protein ImuB
VVVGEPPSDERSPRARGAVRLDVVSSEARRLGVRAGQTVAEAQALASGLLVEHVSEQALEGALTRVAEALMALGAVVSIAVKSEPQREASIARRRWDGPWDTVWLDVTGVAHLHGGEEQLVTEVLARVGALGHAARAALASGPRLAQALARHATASHPARRTARVVIEPGREREAMAPLSVHALPIEREVAAFLVRLGVLHVGDLACLPRAQVLARLERSHREPGGDKRALREAELALELAVGSDVVPLVACAPPRVVVESASFEEGIASTEAMSFVLRGLVLRACERLTLRGEATSVLELRAPYERSRARARAVEEGLVRAEQIYGGHDGGGALVPAALEVVLELAAPVHDPEELFRALRIRLEHTALYAPVVELSLALSGLGPAPRVQLDLGRDAALDETKLPALLAELSAELGRERVGTLELVDAHELELRSRLAPIRRVDPGRARGSRRAGSKQGAGARRDARSTQGEQPWLPLAGEGATPQALGEGELPTRLFSAPVPLGSLRHHGGSLWEGSIEISLAEGTFLLASARHWLRQEGLSWWTGDDVSRDYARVWMSEVHKSPSGVGRSLRTACEALVFVDRRTGEAYLQGYWE